VPFLEEGVADMPCHADRYFFFLRFAFGFFFGFDLGR
jgi:hypothetical protein